MRLRRRRRTIRTGLPTAKWRTLNKVMPDTPLERMLALHRDMTEVIDAVAAELDKPTLRKRVLKRVRRGKVCKATVTLLDLARSSRSDRGVAKVIKILGETNVILDDMKWVEGDLPRKKLFRRRRK